MPPPQDLTEFQRQVAIAFKAVDTVLRPVAYDVRDPLVLSAAVGQYLACIIAGAPDADRQPLTEALLARIVLDVDKLQDHIKGVNLQPGPDAVQ